MNGSKEYIATLLVAPLQCCIIALFVTFRNSNLFKCRVLSHQMQKAANMSKRVAINWNRSRNNKGSSVKGSVCFIYLNEMLVNKFSSLLLLTDSSEVGNHS